MEACIFDIKRFAIHDGPGIRVTVFFKGCPLSCRWCHNPEGIPDGLVSHSHTVLFNGISLSEDIEIGRWVEIEDLVAEVERDRVFMEETGGGVTFSGGEPLHQDEALLTSLDLFRERGIHTCVDTSGLAPTVVMEEVCKRSDLILFDLKTMDENKHTEFTGSSNSRILQNLDIALSSDAETRIRIPLIPGFNDSALEIQAMKAFLSAYGNLKHVDILPYHSYANHKYRKFQPLDQDGAFHTPDPEKLREVRQNFESAGYDVTTGG